MAPGLGGGRRAAADDIVDLGLAEISLMVTPSCSRAQLKTVSPTASPPLGDGTQLTSKRAFGSGTAFIIIFSAVGKKKAFLTPYFSISQKAFSGSKRPR
ncbi:MAG: hypothetical protein M5R42_07695 [Rhodocyclaceae bacterium]|nr:hypothetical protein [Rhodocyclaceae bacterium]